MIVGMFSFVLLVAALVLLLLAGVLFVEIVASFLPRRMANAAAPARPYVIAVLVPAHDESSGVKAALDSIKGDLGPNDRLVVVADNCTDDTAAVAARAGAEVIERNNPALRGKGYALDYGVRHLEKNPPDVVAIVDADCFPAPGSLRMLVSLVMAQQRPAQGLYLLEQPAGASSPYLKIAQIAWKLKLWVRPLGLNNLGLPCQLGGTGMAFPWPLMKTLDLHTGNIVEDIALGLECAEKGQPAVFCGAAVFTSPFPANAEGQQIQRKRWETGHLNIIARRVPKLLYKAIVERNFDLLVLCCDIAVPPVAFLVLAIALVWLLSLVLVISGGWSAPLWAVTWAGLLFVLGMAAAREKIGRDIISLSDLGMIPAYIYGKLLLYVRILAGRQVEWIRSRRD